MTNTVTGEVPQDCSAFIYRGSREFLSYYDNHLYTIREAVDLKSKLYEFGTYQLLRIALDGTEINVALEFDYDPFAISIHRDKLFVAGNSIVDDTEKRYQLLMYNMKDLSEKPVVIFEGNGINGKVSDIYPYGESIYFDEQIPYNDHTWRYDLETKTVTELFGDKEKTSRMHIRGFGKNQLLYLMSNDSMEAEDIWKARLASLEGEPESVLDELDPQVMPEYTLVPNDPHLYARPIWGYLEEEQYSDVKNELSVFDEQYKLIGTVDTSFATNIITTLYGGDAHYMFVKHYENDEEVWYALDKSQIATGNAKFTKFFATQRPSVSFNY